MKLSFPLPRIHWLLGADMEPGECVVRSRTFPLCTQTCSVDSVLAFSLVTSDPWCVSSSKLHIFPYMFASRIRRTPLCSPSQVLSSWQANWLWGDRFPVLLQLTTVSLVMNDRHKQKEKGNSNCQAGSDPLGGRMAQWYQQFPKTPLLTISPCCFLEL